jgi:type IV secretory pathway VirB2 component (pilin)
MDRNKVRFVFAAFVVLFFITPVAFADSTGDIASITEPLNRIYDLVKGVVSVGAVLILTFAGVKFMVSGDNMQAREGSKSMLTYAVLGLVIVWVAPLLVGFLTAPAI